MKILVTGCAGFIGMHLCQKLLERGDEVFGVDNLNDYYDPLLKRARLEQLKSFPNFQFKEVDIANYALLETVFKAERPVRVINLAAQAGVRYSLQNPHVYIQSNVVGFMNILELCRHHEVEHLVYASSSSVYGANTKMPLSVHDTADHPVSLYAASKKSNELMAHTYSHLYGLPVTGLRYFTVYGPWGRPDMSPWLFTSAILEERSIDVFNNGMMLRDFTYIDDAVEGTIQAMDKLPDPNPIFSTDEPDPATSYAPYRVYNIGNSRPTELLTFIETLERAIGKSAIKHMMPMQAGDVLATHADVGDSERDIGFSPITPLDEGVAKWVEWYKAFHGC